MYFCILYIDTPKLPFSVPHVVYVSRGMDVSSCDLELPFATASSFAADWLSWYRSVFRCYLLFHYFAFFCFSSSTMNGKEKRKF